MFRGKRITALFAAVLVCMVMPAFAGNGMTFAADTIAKVTVNGEGTKSYSSFEKMVSDLSDYEDKSVTIEMLQDWNAAKTKDFNRRIVIPEDSSVTLNMHGHVFSRNNS